MTVVNGGGSEAGGQGGGRTRRDAALCLAIAFATLTVYVPSLGHDFVTLDDYPYVVENEAIQQGLGLDTVAWAFTTFHGSSWFPLTWLSFAVDHAIGGLDPSVYHRTNLFWHAAGAALLYLALASLTGARGRSAFVALVFALHPIHVESVAWVAERKDVLSAFFFAATLLAWSHYVARPSAGRYVCVFVALALGLMSKSSGVTLPFVLLLLDEWPLARTQVAWSKRIVEKLPLFVLAGCAVGLTYVAGASGDALESEAGLAFGHRLANAAIAYASYLRDTFWPADLSPFYPHPGRGVSVGLGVLCGGALALVTAIAWWRRRTAPHFLVGWLWFLGVLVPMIGLVQAGPQARADRFVHLAQIGFVVALVWSIPTRVFDTPRTLLGLRVVALFTVVAMAWATRGQLEIWENGVTLYEHMVDRSPNSAFVRHGLAQAYQRDRRFAAAAKADRRAHELAPEWVAPMVGLARALDAAGREDEATPWYARAAERAPHDLGLRATLAERLIEERAFESAAPHLEFVAANGDAVAAADALVLLGALAEQKGDVALAADRYRKAAALRSDLAAPHLALSKLALAGGNEAEAIAALRAATRAEEESLVAHNDLAWHLATASRVSVRTLEEARRHAERAAALSNRQEPAVLETLAVVQLAQGQRGMARDTLDEAIELARSGGDRALQRQLLRRKRALDRANPGGEAR